jgi:DNA-binding IclR family transcriptional regulator
MARKSDLLTDSLTTLHDKKQSRHFVTALSRGLDILALFSRDVPLLGNDEISQKTGLPRSTVTRLTYTLVATRHLVYVPSAKKYKLGAATLVWSYAAMEHVVGVRAVKPFMQDFADQIEASTVALSINAGIEMIYVAHCAGPSLVRIRTGVGTRLKLWESAAGRTFWAASDDAAREALMPDLQQLPQGEYEVAIACLRSAESEYQRYGFCTSIGGWRAGVNAVGCPAWNATAGSEKLVIACGGSSPEFDQQTIYEEIGPKLKEFALFLSPRLTQGSE